MALPAPKHDAVLRFTWLPSYKLPTLLEPVQSAPITPQTWQTSQSPTATTTTTSCTMRFFGPPRAQSASSTPPADSEDLYEFPLIRRDSLITLASDTAPNLPGLGRTLDRIYSSWGKGLERLVEAFAHKAKMTPQSLECEIASVFSRYERDVGPPGNRRKSLVDIAQLEAKDRKEVTKYCKSLLRSTQYVKDYWLFGPCSRMSPRDSRTINQVAALNAIVVVVLHQPALCPLFNQEGGVRYLQQMIHRAFSSNEDCDSLLCSARRALACVKEVEVFSIIHQMEYLPEMEWSVSRMVDAVCTSNKWAQRPLTEETKAVLTRMLGYVA